jgi:hypothetical protein
VTGWITCARTWEVSVAKRIKLTIEVLINEGNGDYGTYIDDNNELQDRTEQEVKDLTPEQKMEDEKRWLREGEVSLNDFIENAEPDDVTTKWEVVDV